jgi:hypothetical protein
MIVLIGGHLRSAVRVWRGAASALNERYRKYIEPLGVIVLPARPGTPEHKGKRNKSTRRSCSITRRCS